MFRIGNAVGMASTKNVMAAIDGPHDDRQAPLNPRGVAVPDLLDNHVRGGGVSHRPDQTFTSGPMRKEQQRTSIW